LKTYQESKWAVTAGVALLLLLPSGAAEADLSSRPAGTVVVWGSNSQGQRNVPAGLTDVVAIAAGWGHTLALKRDGTVVAWGSNVSHESLVPPGLSDVVSIMAGTWNSWAFKSDGTFVAWGTGWGMDQVPVGSHDIAMVAPSKYGYHHAAVKTDGTVEVWGFTNEAWFDDHDVPAIKTVPGDLHDVIAVATGNRHVVALKGDGSVVAWGQNYWVSRITGGEAGGMTSIPLGLDDVVSIQAGSHHSLALQRDGTVHAWGGSWGNTYTHDQWIVPSGLSNVVALAALRNDSLALTSDGAVVGWGSDIYGVSSMAPGPIGAIAIAAGYESHALALKSDGTVVAWGAGGPGQSGGSHVGQSIVPDGLRDVIAIAAGRSHSVALVVDRTPRLEAHRAASHLRLAWPEFGSDYHLEVTEDLSDPHSWVVEPTVPILVDSQHVVTLEPPSGNRFFRLKRE
jgi:alpha-tubulin suppressor-like RCC1 family protein